MVAFSQMIVADPLRVRTVASTTRLHKLCPVSLDLVTLSGRSKVQITYIEIINSQTESQVAPAMEICLSPGVVFGSSVLRTGFHLPASRVTCLVLSPT